MQIAPMRDLKNTVEIEHTMQKINEANFINKGIADYEAGRVVEGKSALKRLREKRGIYSLLPKKNSQ